MPLTPDEVFECEAWTRGFRRVAGLDEVGCGPLAGPVVAAAVILPRRCRALIGLRDSKRLNKLQRERFYELIRRVAVGCGVGIIDAKVIDAVNIRQAARLAMEYAVRQLSPPPAHRPSPFGHLARAAARLRPGGKVARGGRQERSGKQP